MRRNCGSNHNIVRVHRRLDGAIDQLGHDTHDYGGHRVTAMNDLQSARGEIVAAESYAQSVYHDNPSCFSTSSGVGGSDRHWGHRGQNGSNVNLQNMSQRVGRLISQLQEDRRDYGGHRVTAINDMQQAQNELTQAAQYQTGHPRATPPAL